MKIHIEGEVDATIRDAFDKIRALIFEKLGGDELRDTASFNDVRFHILSVNNMIPSTLSRSRYYQKTKRLDLPVLIPYSVFANRNEEGRVLLTINKMLTAIRKVHSKNLVRKEVYALFLLFKRRLNPAYDPEEELTAMMQQVGQECRNSIRIYINGTSKGDTGKTRFGGMPDVPPDFEWPTYTAKDDRTGKEQTLPLSFLAQFNCKDLARYDKEGRLPDHGVLSFFYELNRMTWGFDPKDSGSAKVYWFEDSQILRRAKSPEGFPETPELPMMTIRMREFPSYPEYDDLNKELLTDASEELYEKALKNLKVKERYESSKLLGWPENIQGSMFLDAEYASKGYYLDAEGWASIPLNERLEKEKTVREEWQLLLQLDTVASEEHDFELMFEDCGRIYYFIRTEDLKNRRFDNVWLILQSL